MDELKKDSKEDKTLTNMIKDITFHYIDSLSEVVSFALMDDKVSNPVNFS